MKAIAINGSPRPGGNTEIMLKKVLEPLEAAGWSTEYLRIGGKPVRGCMACLKCFEKRNGRCSRREGRYERLPGTDLRG